MPSTDLLMTWRNAILRPKTELTFAETLTIRKRSKIMSPATHILRSVSEGLIFGFTFAIGWFAALLLLGAVVV